jgi:hypothetical protein
MENLLNDSIDDQAMVYEEMSYSKLDNRKDEGGIFSNLELLNKKNDELISYQSERCGINYNLTGQQIIQFRGDGSGTTAESQSGRYPPTRHKKILTY